MGLSMEASVIACRPDINRAFYGLDTKPSLLLSGLAVITVMKLAEQSFSPFLYFQF